MANLERNIRDYLLGRVSPERVEQIEEKIMLDDDFFQEVEIAETELLDDYIRGHLTPQEVQLFRQNFMRNEVRQEGLRFAAAFKEKIDLTSPVPVGADNATVSFRPAARFWSLSLFASAALVAVVLGGTTIYLESRLKQEQSQVASLSGQLEESRQRDDARAKQWLPQNALALAYLSKSSQKGTGAEGGWPEVSLAPGVRVIQFIIAVPKGLKTAVAVKLLSDAGHMIALDSAVFPRDIGQEHVLITTFPAEHLERRNYFLRLEADEKEPHAADVNGKEYPFKIR